MDLTERFVTSGVSKRYALGSPIVRTGSRSDSGELTARKVNRERVRKWDQQTCPSVLLSEKKAAIWPLFFMLLTCRLTTPVDPSIVNHCPDTGQVIDHATLERCHADAFIVAMNSRELGFRNNDRIEAIAGDAQVPGEMAVGEA